MPDETTTVCEHCEHSTEECACPVCDGCSETFPDDATCIACSSCPECCSCWTCPHCNERIPDSQPSACGNCEHCESCCDCSHCESCGPTTENVCGNCQCCERHCGCWYCETCNEEHGNDTPRCLECENCASECTCSQGEVRFMENPLKFHKAKVTEHKRNPSKRFIACELECSGAAGGDAIESCCEGWSHSIVRDGSLPSGGFEVTTSPASGDRFCAMAEEIGAALEDDGARVNDDCGFHIHVDARDFTYYEVRKLIMLYAKIEQALFGVIAPSRRGSSYCQPCAKNYLQSLKDVKSTRPDVNKAVYGSAAPRWRKKNKYDHSRYHALNLHSYFFRGTVECRLHTGTTNPNKIICWGLLWAAILDSAYAMTEKEIALLPEGMPCLLKIAPTDEVRGWLKARYAKFN